MKPHQTEMRLAFFSPLSPKPSGISDYSEALLPHLAQHVERIDVFIEDEKATLISTTSGMPLAPVAASTRPFSSDMKPITWLTALRRVTMI